MGIKTFRNYHYKYSRFMEVNITLFKQASYMCKDSKNTWMHLMQVNSLLG